MKLTKKLFPTPKGVGKSIIIELFSHYFYLGLFKNIMSLLATSLQFQS